MADPFQCQTLGNVSRTKAIVTRLSLMQNGESFQNRLTNSSKELYFLDLIVMKTLNIRSLL